MAYLLDWWDSSSTSTSESSSRESDFSTSSDEDDVNGVKMESTTNTSVYTCEQNLTKEYKGAKKKLAIPQRMLEDDVWLSGSELRTDNSSSDEEEKIPSKKIEEDDFKKGARKKTTRTKTKVVKSHTEKHQYSETTECTETVTSMTSGNYEMMLDDSSDIPWRPKRGSLAISALSDDIERVNL